MTATHTLFLVVIILLNVISPFTYSRPSNDKTYSPDEFEQMTKRINLLKSSNLKPMVKNIKGISKSVDNKLDHHNDTRNGVYSLATPVGSDKKSIALIPWLYACLVWYTYYLFALVSSINKIVAIFGCSIVTLLAEGRVFGSNSFVAFLINCVATARCLFWVLFDRPSWLHKRVFNKSLYPLQS